MNFEWDEAKSDACFRDRGFDFAYAIQAFLDPDRLIHPDTRHSYGEPRYRLMGSIDQRVRSGLYAAPRCLAHHFRAQGESKGDPGI